MRSLFTRAARGALLFACLAVLAACVRPTETARIPADPALAEGTWARFMQSGMRAESLAEPFRLNATLYYSGKEDSQRVTVYFWGNAATKPPLPLRLDILMGPGSIMAAAREDSRGLFIHVPRDNAVYHTEDSSLLAFDVPVPFSLTDLAYLVTGRFASLFAPADGDFSGVIQSAEQGAGGATVYTIEDAPLEGKVSIDANGLPVAWTGGGESGWTLAIDYWPDSTRTTPRKLHVQHAGGRQATLIVRELAHPAPFTPKQLELNVPQGTRLAPLEVRQ